MQLRQYVIQRISDEIDGIVSKKYPKAGPKSTRQSWLRALVYIDILDNHEAGILWKYSLRIAKLRRGDDDLQFLPVLKIKLEQEMRELDFLLKQKPTRIELASRLSNILYYGVQIYVQDGDLTAFHNTCEQQCSRVGISPEIAFQCATAKFGNRAFREIKDIPSEMRDIKQILKEAENSSKYP